MSKIYLHPKISPEFKPNIFYNHADGFQDIFKKFIFVHLNTLELIEMFAELTKNLD